jgi:hypothetical protein
VLSSHRPGWPEPDWGWQQAARTEGLSVSRERKTRARIYALIVDTVLWQQRDHISMNGRSKLTCTQQHEALYFSNERGITLEISARGVE